MTAYRPVGYWTVCKLKQDANEGCNSCASLAGLVLCFIACFILLVIAPLGAQCCSSAGCECEFQLYTPDADCVWPLKARYIPLMIERRVTAAATATAALSVDNSIIAPSTNEFIGPAHITTANVGGPVRAGDSVYDQNVA